MYHAQPHAASMPFNLPEWLAERYRHMARTYGQRSAKTAMIRTDIEVDHQAVLLGFDALIALAEKQKLEIAGLLQHVRDAVASPFDSENARNEYEDAAEKCRALAQMHDEIWISEQSGDL